MHLMQKRLRWYGHVSRRDDNSAGHGGGRCEAERKTNITIYGHHQERHKKEWAVGRQHSRSQELETGSFKGDLLTRKSLQGEKSEERMEKKEITLDMIDGKRREHPR